VPAGPPWFRVVFAMNGAVETFNAGNDVGQEESTGGRPYLPKTGHLLATASGRWQGESEDHFFSIRRQP
jgi:hypothetical protein